MLALVFPLGHFLGVFSLLLCVSSLLVEVLGPFFGVPDRSGLDFGGFGSHPGTFYEPPRPIFPLFLVHASLLCAQTLDKQKPRKFFLGFKHIARVAHKTKNNTKSIQKPVEQSFPQRSCSKHVLGLAELHSGRVRDRLGRLLGAA